MKKISGFPSLIALTICALGLMTCAVSAQPLPNPAAQWLLNGNANEMFSGASATTTDGVSWAQQVIRGQSNTVASFDGTGGIVLGVVPSNIICPPANGSFSVSAWVNVTNWSTTDLNNLFDIFTAITDMSSPHQVAIQSEFNQSRTALNFNATDASWSPQSLNVSSFASGGMSLNEWYHIVWTYDQGVMHSYLDSNPLSEEWSISDSLNILSHDAFAQITIGRNVAANGNPPFQGFISDVRLYDTSLSPNQVSSLYTAGVPEPSTYALLLLGGAASLWALKRRKS